MLPASTFAEITANLALAAVFAPLLRSSDPEPQKRSSGVNIPPGTRSQQMKHLAIAAVALALATTAAHATADGCAVVRKTPDGFLNLREFPKAGSPIVGRVVPGDLLSISGDETCEKKGTLSICNEQGWTKVDSKWTKATRPDRITWVETRGWAATRFLDFVECHGAELEREKRANKLTLAAPATIAFPAAYQGRWCPTSEPKIYVRCGDEYEDIIWIGPRDWKQMHGMGCKVQKITPDGNGYLVGSRCRDKPVYVLKLELIGPRRLQVTPKTEIATEKDQETARLAWAKAVSLAKERNSGNVCVAEAYQSAIIAELGVAVKLSPYLKNEVVQGKSASVEALQQALAGNLMLSDLLGKMTTPKQVAKAMVGSVWYSRDGGAMGSLSILEIEKNYVRELVVDSESKRRPVIWTYSFDATTRELTLRRGTTTRHYKLEREDIELYGLTNLDGDVGYYNEPDDCSA